jgi:hypothetical protein
MIDRLFSFSLSLFLNHFLFTVNYFNYFGGHIEPESITPIDMGMLQIEVWFIV